MSQTHHVTVHLRTAPAKTHPKYGLYVDPHGGRHAWLAVDGKLVVGLLAAVAGVGTALNLLVH